MLDTILDSPLSPWLQHDTDATDHIVISSRIRLARNFDGILFTNRNDKSSLEKVNTISRGLLQPLKEADGHQYSNINLEQLSERERAILVEKHLMSPALEEKLPYRNLVVSDDASIVIMVNEEDHLRIQSMVSGLRLQKAYEHAKKIDKAIEDGKKYEYVLDSTRYFFVDKFYETDFPKITPRAPMGSRMFDLTEVLQIDKLPKTEEIAGLLKQKSWNWNSQNLQFL